LPKTLGIGKWCCGESRRGESRQRMHGEKNKAWENEDQKNTDPAAR